MDEHHFFEEEENTYLLDPESEQEMARLDRQGRLVTQVVGLLPPSIDPFHFPSLRSGQHRPRVLDIGCGTGNWALDLGAKYRHLSIDALDISQRMVAYASAEAESRELPNVTFRVMNALKPLVAFADETFDLINIRIAVGFIPRGKWQTLFQECWRLLRPGGLLLSTEGEGGVTTYQNPATAQGHRWLAQALWVRGLGFWDGQSTFHGIHLMQGKFFENAGFEHLNRFLFFGDASYGTPLYHGWKEIPLLILRQIEPLVTTVLGVPQAFFNETVQKCEQEVQRDTWTSYTLFQSLTGQKPISREESQ